jgi:hypothetical protein
MHAHVFHISLGELTQERDRESRRSYFSSTLTFFLQVDPLSYDPPDITSDFEAIYGEGAAGNFFSPAPFPSPLAKSDKSLLALQDGSPHADVFPEFFGPELTPESPPSTESSPSSTSGYASVRPIRFLPS